VIAATGPLIVGAVHDGTGGWTLPLLVILGAVVVMAVVGAPSAGGRDQSGGQGAEPVPEPLEEVQRG
jgi:MFS transporter, CP family, cyanate transporter